MYMYIRYDPGVITQYVDLFRDHSQEHDVCISLEQKYLTITEQLWPCAGFGRVFGLLFC